MARIIYVEKTITVSAGQSAQSTVYVRTGEKQAYIHYLAIKTDSNTSTAVLYIDGYKFTPSIGPSTLFEIGKPVLYDKLEVKDNITINVTASSTGQTTVQIYGFIEVG
ncbi:MAG: hypothetical protein LM558_00230 [Thermosphaera sp.]|nr:hypothetical protein [Thermosphaera sp.]